MVLKNSTLNWVLKLNIEDHTVLYISNSKFVCSLPVLLLLAKLNHDLKRVESSTPDVNGLFLYSLRTSEKTKFSDIFKV